MEVDTDPLLGSELLGYRLEEPVGQGGMGVVYRAYDPRLKRNVALKLLAPDYAQDERFRERFLAETELAASLEHPNVVPIHDAGEVEGRLYLVMRYVEGEDLKRLLQKQGRLDPARALSICAQVADALDAAHERGLVHRDVKPSNVLLDSREHAYLADFGLTRRLADQAPGFDAGLSLGTPAYVAPEQIEGKVVNGRADQYSLACLLTECLIGEPPFPRTSEAAVLFAHLEEAPPAPPGLEEVMQRALTKDPVDRYESCAAFVEAAREALGVAEPRASRWPLALAGVGAALLGAALLAFLLARDDGGAEQLPGRDSLIRIDPSTNDVVGTIRVGQNPSAVAVGDVAGVWVASRDDGAVSRVDPATNRIALRASAHGQPTEIAVSGVVAIVSNGPQDANLAVIHAPSGREENVISLAAGGSFLGSARVAAGGPDIWMAGADRRVGRLDLAANRIVDPVLLEPPHDERRNAYFSGIAVTDDAVWVVGDLLDPKVWRIDPATGEITAEIRLPFAPKDVAAGAGAVWVTSQLDDTVSRIDPRTNRITATVPVGRGAAGLAVGAGSVWVANAIDATVSRIDPDGPRVVETIDLEGSPDDVAATDGAVWVTTHEVPDAPPRAEDAVRIGLLTACEGFYGLFADPSLAGAELPLLQRGARLAGPRPADGVQGAIIAGKEVQLLFGCGDDTAEKALSESRRLVEQAGVDVLIGSTQIGEAFAIKEYARKHPDVTFLDGTASGQAHTLRRPAANVFRFSTDGAQWMAGLGAFAYNELGWRNAVTVADDEGFSYTQVAGFVAEFCSLGGNIAERVWVPIGTQDYAPYLAQVPARGVDGFLLASSPATTIAFADGAPELKGKLARKVVMGILSLTGLVGSGRRNFSGVVLGLPTPPFLSDVPLPGGQRAWRAYLEEFDKAFPADIAGYGGTIFPVFYRNAMDAVLGALEAVEGDLGEGQRRFRAALADVVLEAPNGRIRLDRNRQAVGTNYLVRVDTTGSLSPLTFRTVPNVEQTFNGYFGRTGPLPSRTSPPCKKGNPPPWARR
jgi:YVTN family beta-propeller protein